MVCYSTRIHAVRHRSLPPRIRLRASRRPGPCRARAGRRAEPRRQAPGAARRHRIGQDLQHGAGDLAREPAHAGDGAQQDAGGAAVPGVPALLPEQRRRVLRQLLRLLPAGSLRAGQRHVYREGIDHQRRDRSHAAVGHAIALRAPRRDHRRQRVVHLRPGLAGCVLRPGAAARKRAAHRSRSDPAQAGRDPVRAQRSRVRARQLPGPRRHHRGLSVVRRVGASHRPVRRRDRRADVVRSDHRARRCNGTSARRCIRSRTS